MDVEKLRNLTDAELTHQQRELNDQLFRMKFQLKMGQTESLNKIRGLRKDVARIKTIMREKELGLTNGSKAAAAASEEATETVKPAKAKPARTRTSAAARKTAATKKKTVAAKAKKKSAGAKAKARKK